MAHKAKQDPPRKKPVSGVSVGHRPGHVSKATKLVEAQNRGATASGYPEKEKAGVKTTNATNPTSF